MKEIAITKEDILKGFCREDVMPDNLHKELIEAVKKHGVTIDKKGDFCVLGHWVTIDFSVTQMNVNALSIDVIYEVHEGAKCSEVLYTIRR